jgi:hypothetical protein
MPEPIPCPPLDTLLHWQALAQQKSEIHGRLCMCFDTELMDMLRDDAIIEEYEFIGKLETKELTEDEEAELWLRDDGVIRTMLTEHLKVKEDLRMEAAQQDVSWMIPRE